MSEDCCRPDQGRSSCLIDRLRRRPYSWLVLLAVAALVWMFLKPWVSQRVLSIDLRLQNASPDWALEWTRASNGLRNGAWLDVPEPPLAESEPLEIHILGRADGQPGAVEFWLYHVFSLNQAQNPDGTPRYRKPDLKQIIADAGPEQIQGHWIPFWADEGIVFSGSDGWLRFDAPPDGVRLHLAKTPTGSLVRLRYGNTEQMLNLHAPTTSFIQVELRRTIVIADATIHASQDLPSYELGELALQWENSSGATIEVGNMQLVEKVFGIPTRYRHLVRQVEEGARVLPTAVPWRAEIGASAGRITLLGRTAFGTTSWLTGYGLVVLALAGLRVLTVYAARVPWRSLARHLTVERVAILLVIGVRVWMMLWAPLLVSYDGVQYISNAQSFLDTGSTESFGGGGFRMPGYSLPLTVFLGAFRDFGPPLLVFQGLLGIGVALLCYDTLRSVLSRPWPVLGLLYVGLDPVLLAYEHLALTESVSTFCATFITWLVVRRLRATAGRLSIWRAIAGAAAFGLLCALSAYVRSSLQVFFAAIPLAILVIEWRRGTRAAAIVCAATMVLFSVLGTVPWTMRNARLAGRAEFAPYGVIQRMASLWDADALDLNQVPVYSRGQWNEIRNMGYFSHTYLWILLQQSDFAPARGLDFWSRQEKKSQFLVDETTARRPVNMVKGGFVAFCNQIGLWNKLTQHSGRENAHWSRPLRGDPYTKTNLFDGYSVEEYVAARERLPQIERDIGDLRKSYNAMWFNDAFFAYELTRPVIAILFLIGLGWAVYRRCYPIAIVGMICLAHVLAMSVLVLSAIDRYGVPFKPLIAVVALWALAQIAAARRPAAAPPSAV